MRPITEKTGVPWAIEIWSEVARPEAGLESSDHPGCRSMRLAAADGLSLVLRYLVQNRSDSRRRSGPARGAATQAFFTNSDFRFIAPMPSTLQAMLCPSDASVR